jgi:hypothetical protein
VYGISLAVTEPVLAGISLTDPAMVLARALIRELAPNKLKRFVPIELLC